MRFFLHRRKVWGSENAILLKKKILKWGLLLTSTRLHPLQPQSHAEQRLVQRVGLGVVSDRRAASLGGLGTAGRQGVAVGQGVARWRARGGEAALAQRLGAHAPEVVARPRRTRRTRGRRGSPGAAAALLAPRAPRGRREAPSARRSSRKRAQTAPGLPTQDPCPIFFSHS